MKFIKRTPNILAGRSLQDFIGYNLYYFIATFLLVGVQRLIIYPFIARKLGSENFGSFILFMTIINIIIVVIPSCINQVIIRVHSEFKKQKKIGLVKSGVILNILLSLMIAILFYFSFPYFADIFKIAPIYKIFLLPLTLYFIIYNTRESVMILKRIFLKFKQIAFYNIIFALLFFLIIPLYYIFDKRGISYGYVFVAIIATLILVPTINKIFSGIIEKKYLRRFYEFSPSFAFVSILELLLIASSRYIISFYQDPTRVAYFFAATSIVKILIFPFQQIRTILLPFISQKKSLAEFKSKEIKIILFTSLAIGVGVFAFGVIFGKIIITFLYGAEYFKQARIVLYIILFGYIFNIIKIYLKNFIMIFFKRKVLVINVAVMLAINVMINIIFVPKYGINAAAVALSVSIILSTVMWYAVFLKTWKNLRHE